MPWFDRNGMDGYSSSFTGHRMTKNEMAMRRPRRKRYKIEFEYGKAAAYILALGSGLVYGIRTMIVLRMTQQSKSPRLLQSTFTYSTNLHRQNLHLLLACFLTELHHTSVPSQLTLHLSIPHHLPHLPSHITPIPPSHIPAALHPLPRFSKP